MHWERLDTLLPQERRTADKFSNSPHLFLLSPGPGLTGMLLSIFKLDPPTLINLIKIILDDARSYQVTPQYSPPQRALIGRGSGLRIESSVRQRQASTVIEPHPPPYLRGLYQLWTEFPQLSRAGPVLSTNTDAYCCRQVPFSVR